MKKLFIICVLVTVLPCFAAASEKIVKKTPGKNALEGLGRLRVSVVSLTEKYPAYRGKGEVFLSRIASYEKKLKEGDSNTVMLKKIGKFRHEVITSNPLVRDNPILFVTRRQYKSDHHNTATMFQTGELNTRSYDPVGAYMKTIDFSQGAKVTTIVDPGAQGLIRDPEVHYDGDKIIFSMRKNIEDNYHIYEIKTDGSQLKQLTSAEGVFDIDPVYLPDGNIVFTSSREPKFCMCNRHIMGNMFKMEADGANIHQIGKSTLFEGHSAMLEDGRIIYDRWEYVDRNFGDAQGLWVVNPDGTNHALYWGNNTASPGAVLDARAIPGTSLVICIFSSCHDRPWGAVAILDRKKGVEGTEPVVRTWPAQAINKISTEGINKYDSYKNLKLKYEDPFPLDENYFLVSRMTGKGEKTGIYLIDTFGNEDMLYAEGDGCFDPKPIKKYRKPRIIPARRDFENKTGKFYVQNAYIGTHMKGVKPGSIKYLRVVESPEKRTWTNPAWGGQGTIAPSMNWHDFINKRILGTVPVEDDGSAFFEAPSDTFLYFQLLDEDGKMIHSMRSGTIIQSSETQGCVGCHEDRIKDTPPVMNIKSLRREASKLEGWNGQPRLFNYLTEVQPVFDRNCVKCHDFGKKAGKKLNLAGDKTVFFNTSYMELWRKKLISCIGAGQSQIQEAYSWGSHKSKLIEVLDKGHNNVKLTKEDYDRLVTWIDINGPYYPTYDSAYPSGTSGRGPLTHAQLKKLSKLTGAKFNANYGSNAGPLVSFDRPKLSRCLQKLEKSSPAYKKALGIIESGAIALAENPRADMPGFKPADYAVKRQKFYDDRENKELENRKAIRENRKMYDKQDQGKE